MRSLKLLYVCLSAHALGCAKIPFSELPDIIGGPVKNLCAGGVGEGGSAQMGYRILVARVSKVISVLLSLEFYISLSPSLAPLPLSFSLSDIERERGFLSLSLLFLSFSLSLSLSLLPLSLYVRVRKREGEERKRVREGMRERERGRGKRSRKERGERKSNKERERERDREKERGGENEEIYDNWQGCQDFVHQSPAIVPTAWAAGAPRPS